MLALTDAQRSRKVALRRQRPEARIVRAVVVGAFMAFLLPACGGDRVEPGPEAAPLELEQVFVAGPGGYTEGARSYVEVEDEQGDSIVEEQLPNTERPSFEVRLDPGVYRVKSWQRICDGDCSKLSPPRDECSRSFTIFAHEPVRGTIRVTASLGCEIMLRRAGPR